MTARTASESMAVDGPPLIAMNFLTAACATDDAAAIDSDGMGRY